MPQEFYILKCYQCETFQVQIVKKSNKWDCKMCGEKQSVKMVYGRGGAKDCRENVQTLNTERIMKEEEKKMMAIAILNESVDKKCNTTNTSPRARNISKWNKFLPAENEIEEVDEDITDGHYTFEKSTKRKQPMKNIEDIGTLKKSKYRNNTLDNSIKNNINFELGAVVSENNAVKVNYNYDHEENIDELNLNKSRTRNYVNRIALNQKNSNVKNVNSKWPRYVDADIIDDNFALEDLNTNNYNKNGKFNSSTNKLVAQNKTNCPSKKSVKSKWSSLVNEDIDENSDVNLTNQSITQNNVDCGVSKQTLNILFKRRNTSAQNVKSKWSAFVDTDVVEENSDDNLESDELNINNLIRHNKISNCTNQSIINNIGSTVSAEELNIQFKQRNTSAQNVKSKWSAFVDTDNVEENSDDNSESDELNINNLIRHNKISNCTNQSIINNIGSTVSAEELNIQLKQRNRGTQNVKSKWSAFVDTDNVEENSDDNLESDELNINNLIRHNKISNCTNLSIINNIGSTVSAEKLNNQLKQRNASAQNVKSKWSAFVNEESAEESSDDNLESDELNINNLIKHDKFDNYTNESTTQNNIDYEISEGTVVSLNKRQASTQNIKSNGSSYVDEENSDNHFESDGLHLSNSTNKLITQSHMNMVAEKITNIPLHKRTVQNFTSKWSRYVADNIEENSDDELNLTTKYNDRVSEVTLNIPSNPKNATPPNIKSNYLINEENRDDNFESDELHLIDSTNGLMAQNNINYRVSEETSSISLNQRNASAQNVISKGSCWGVTNSIDQNIDYRRTNIFSTTNIDNLDEILDF